MDAINQKMQESKLAWKSNAFILDDVDAKSIAKVAIEMLYLSIVWVCTISLKSMFQSYVSKFKFFVFYFRCNSFYNLNMFQYQIMLCFEVHFIMGS